MKPIELPNITLTVDRQMPVHSTVLHLSEEAQLDLDRAMTILILPRKAVVLTFAELRKPIRNANYAVRLMAAFRSRHPDVPIGTIYGGSALWMVHDCLHAMKDCFEDSPGRWDMKGGPQVEADRIREAEAYCRTREGLQFPLAHIVQAWIDFRERFQMEPPPYGGTESLDGGP